jgi:hypothetical protein
MQDLVVILQVVQERATRETIRKISSNQEELF